MSAGHSNGARHVNDVSQMAMRYSDMEQACGCECVRLEERSVGC